ncbi:MAG: polyphosphate kinase 2 family protein [Gammaproteobacteria bacterium]
MFKKKSIDLFRVKTDAKVRLRDFHTGWDQTDELKAQGKKATKERAATILQQSIEELSDCQELLYADDRYAVLIVFQAMDAAGKDGAIKHVMSGVNPQGCQVFSFKTPSSEELDHNFLWRYMKSLPERGRIGIFNRSYYEDVLVVKVHSGLLRQQKLPDAKFGKAFWQARYDDINAFERHLVRNGTLILKFFLHVSKDEQKKRFMDRLEQPEKHWKFSLADLHERSYWDDYVEAYEKAISATNSKWAPWYIVPADDKWATRAVVADIVTSTLRGLKLKFPKMSEEQHEMLDQARKTLADER